MLLLLQNHQEGVTFREGSRAVAYVTQHEIEQLSFRLNLLFVPLKNFDKDFFDLFLNCLNPLNNRLAFPATRHNLIHLHHGKLSDAQ